MSDIAGVSSVVENLRDHLLVELAEQELVEFKNTLHLLIYVTGVVLAIAKVSITCALERLVQQAIVDLAKVLLQANSLVVGLLVVLIRPLGIFVFLVVLAEEGILVDLQLAKDTIDDSLIGILETVSNRWTDGQEIIRTAFSLLIAAFDFLALAMRIFFNSLIVGLVAVALAGLTSMREFVMRPILAGSVRVNMDRWN